jgi:NAD-dependent dihydropyrimidine dehydrogenase PreA subunit
MAYISFFEKIRIPTYDDPEQVQYGQVTIDNDKCTGCLLCIKLCPADVLVKEDGTPVMKKQGDHECMACADCAAACPENAIYLTQGLQCIQGRYKTLGQGPLAPPRL